MVNMKNNIEILKNNILFKNFDNSSIESLLTCLSAKKYKYDKNYFIINAGDKINNIGIIIEGKVAVIKEDINGNRNIITELSQSEMFGEAFACSNINKSTVSIQAISDCEILFIDYVVIWIYYSLDHVIPKTPNRFDNNLVFVATYRVYRKNYSRYL